MISPRWLLFTSLLLFPHFIFSQHRNPSSQEVNPWIDSLMSQMTLEEKIGQLFMVATFSNKDESHYASMERLIKEQHLGGLIFMQGNPTDQVKLINRYQKVADVPLLIAQDAEWGLGMRLKETMSYPRNMTLGAIRDDSLIYDLGKQMGLELSQAGVHVNFAPVVDVNNNSRNPVINYRSFGENKYNVARKGIMVSHGMQDNGVIACGKHFPGHGDTDADSHYDLPIINHDITRLDTLELYPFTRLIDEDVKSLLVAHLYIPALDSTPNQATTLSPKVVNGLLRDSLGYDGLIFTDALNMHGVTKYYSDGEVALKAFEAGNDVLLFPSNIPKSARLIKEAIESGKISESALNQSVYRILRAKMEVGLNKYHSLSTDNLSERLNSPAARLLRKKLYEAAITLAKNKDDLVPLRHIEKRKIAYVQIGDGSGNTFDLTIKKYAKVTPFYLRKSFTEGEKQKILNQLREYDTIIIGIMDMNQRAKDNFGITENTKAFCQDLSRLGKQTVLTLFGNPYALSNFGTEDAVVVAYEAVTDAKLAAAMAIFGGIKIDGRLPVTASSQFPEGTGEVISAPIRFGFGMPTENRMDTEYLAKIDSIAEHYIKKGAMPGCAIMVLKGNQIVYDRSFGKTEYGPKGMPIHSFDHTYDLASVTKVIATTLCTMHLVERGVLDLDRPIKSYLPELSGTNKANLTIRRLMQHNAGLPSWIPFYLDTYTDEKKRSLNPDYYAFYATRSSDYPIGPSLYGTYALKEKVWSQLRDVEVRRTNRVRYSDLGMILVGKIIESVSGMPLNEYADYLFYRSLGMDHTCFNPYSRGMAEFCPPTEADTVWRNAIIQGFVHDPASAIIGGVAGHAGLFSNVYDLAKILLMVKNEGIYGGQRYFNPETIREFTKKQLSYNRKGLGWDKPEYESHKTHPTSLYASSETYGHTGFTGTCVWVDPKYDLIYIFLSNRTFPYASNKILLRENVRTQIMDVIYGSMISYQKKVRLAHHP
ncbi:MAG: serine hydrolase [Bacteroidetes bacterium]|nr:serine hydrolase [Bacteroidota bacterium]